MPPIWRVERELKGRQALHLAAAAHSSERIMSYG